MKRIFLFAAMAATALTMSAQMQIETLPVDSAVRVGHLDNGLTYYIRHNELPKQRAEFHIAQAVGAILEEDNQNGLAHFLEHMAFNGTEHFPGKGIINYFESIGVNFGGNINAYTALDETVYRLSEVPTTRQGIIDSALLVMHDWSHSLLLEGDEIDAERGVIREEWRTRASAERRMWSRLNPLMYPGSQYAKRDVIGDTAVINNFSYDALRNYYHKWYGPDLQAIVVVGDIDVDYIENKIKELWADIPARENRGERPLYYIDDNKEPIVAVVTDKEAQYTRIRIDYKKNPLPAEIKNSPIGYQMQLLNSLVTSMFDERMNELSQKPDAPFIGAGAAYTDVVKTKDAFIGIAVAKPGKEKETYNSLTEQLEKIRRYGFTQAEFDRAKQNMLTSYEKAYNERNSNRNIQYTQEYIRNFLDADPIPGIEWEYNFVQQIMPLLPLEAVNQYAMSLPTEENVIVSFTAPEQEGVVLPSEAEIRQRLSDVRQIEIEAPAEDAEDLSLIKKAPKAGKIKKTVKNEELGTTEFTLGNGIKVIIKPTQFKQDEILMSAYSQGGISMVDNAEDLPSAIYAAAITEFAGLGSLNTVQLQKVLTGKHVSVTPAINQYSESMSGNSNVKDFETLLTLTYLYFTQPRKDSESFSTLMQMLETQLKNKATNTKAQFADSVTLMSTDYNPRTIVWNTETLKQVSVDKAYDIYRQRFADAADFTFIFTGNINPDDKQTQRLIAQWLGGLKTSKCKKHKEHFEDRGIRAPKGVKKNYFDKQMTIHQTTNRIQLTNEMPYSLAGDLNMEVIGRVLDMRYLESIREREGGSYGVGVVGRLSRFPVGTATLLIQFDTDPEKEERLMQVIYEEIDNIIKEGPLEQDLKKAKESMLKDFEEDLEKNGFWHNYILPEYYRYQIDYLKEYKAAVNAVTGESVKETLRSLREAGNMFEVVMSPAE